MKSFSRLLATGWEERGIVVLFPIVTVIMILSACGAEIPAITNVQSAPLTRRVQVNPDMLRGETPFSGNVASLADEQALVGNPPTGKPEKGWDFDYRQEQSLPHSVVIDLGSERTVAKLWFFDTFNVGRLRLEVGEPGNWREVAVVSTDRFQSWVAVPLDRACRYLRLSRLDGAANIAEIAVDEYTPAGLADLEARRRAALEREAALKAAEEEARRRPKVNLGPPFGELSLVDEIDCSADPATHGFREDPPGVSEVREILGRPCRVLRPLPDQAGYIAYRIGRYKLLRPGATYLLVIDYPEDAPRHWVVINGGCETRLGFHTGSTLPDALHAKYVDSLPESVRLPLSGEYRRWKMLFRLHDRFPELGIPRGEAERPLVPEDGFTVVVGQFSAPNIPMSKGAAVAAIRLFEVPDEEQLACPIRFPPDPLPRRHVFWREEMADGVIASRNEEKRGLRDPLDWYRFKLATMKFLGIPTYCKDLLEFGACQGWDPSPYGGNRWVHFNDFHKDIWERVVEMMGQAGMEVLPYYEYAGSRGDQGLGYQRRAKPLARDDAYTHISWVENANADVTDPDTWEDFRKMLELTVAGPSSKAPFVGVWLRSRGQLPISFADATLRRFAEETKQDAVPTREHLRSDAALLGRYYDWWFEKRREFLIRVRDYIRANGARPDAVVLYTSLLAESGASFPTWDKTLVTDDPATWESLLQTPPHRQDKKWRVLALSEVVERGLYLDALLSPPLNWGGWEWHHAHPAPDPERYATTEGVLMTYAFNRFYTVLSPPTLARFRGPGGLAIVRHYPLNEDMMFDAQDKPKLDYFVADIEHAGPFCMAAEALAVANGDPWFIGYLTGNSLARGFPEHVRAFNQAFLSLPALPSEVVSGLASDAAIVVRRIEAADYGTYFALVNTDCRVKPGVVVRLPEGTYENTVSGEILDAAQAVLTHDFAPYELWTVRRLPNREQQ
ncbi:hypothetical protein [Thermopirellula anaerolimosa]